METEALAIRNIRKTFGGTIALDTVSISFSRGEIHALLGINGSGKSTLVKIITGVVKKDSGTILLKNKDIEVASPIHARALSINAIYQESALIPFFTAAQNIFLGHEPTSAFWGHIDQKKLRENIESILKEFDMHIPLDVPVEHFGMGEQRIIEVAKALSYESDIIFVDEATAGMSDREIRVFFTILKRLREKGKTIIYISHYLEEIFAIADRLTILKDGKLISTKLVKATNLSSVIQKMIGKDDFFEMFPPKNEPREKECFKTTNLQCKGKFSHLSFSLKQGEILGIAGLMGAGKSELARCIFGAENKTCRGTIEVNGKRHEIGRAYKGTKIGIYLVSEDRKRYGIFPMLSLAENIVTGNTSCGITVPVVGSFRKTKMNNHIEKVTKKVCVKYESTDQSISSLSGGNQQKVILGKWLLRDPDVLLLDEPTRGIDVGAKAEVYKIVVDLAREGKGIILFSSEIPEIVGLCTRVLILYKGKIKKELTGSEITSDTVLYYVMGGEEADNVKQSEDA